MRHTEDHCHSSAMSYLEIVDVRAEMTVEVIVFNFILLEILKSNRRRRGKCFLEGGIANFLPGVCREFCR